MTITTTCKPFIPDQNDSNICLSTPFSQRSVSVFLHYPFHLAHLTLQEAVDGNFAAIGVEGDGRETGDGRMNVLTLFQEPFRNSTYAHVKTFDRYIFIF